MAKDEMEKETALRDRREGSAERNRAAGIVPEIIPALPSQVVTTWRLHKDRMAYFIGVRASGLKPDTNWRILVKDGVAEVIDDTDSDGGHVIEEMKIPDHGPGPLDTDRNWLGATSDDDKRKEQRVPGSADLRSPANQDIRKVADHDPRNVGDHPDRRHPQSPLTPGDTVDEPGLPPHGGQAGNPTVGGQAVNPAVNPGSMPEHRQVGEAARNPVDPEHRHVDGSIRNPVVDSEHKPAVTHEVKPAIPPEVKPPVVGHGPVISPEPRKK